MPHKISKALSAAERAGSKFRCHQNRKAPRGGPMTDRLSLTNALADANIDRQKAERIATEIFDAIHDRDP